VDILNKFGMPDYKSMPTPMVMDMNKLSENYSD
jgi:hypothetical protein